MDYGFFKDLNRRTAADKVLRDKAFNIAKDLKYDGYQSGLASMVYKFFDKKNSGSGMKNEKIPNKELVEEFHKPNQLLKILIKGKCIHLLLINLGVKI